MFSITRLIKVLIVTFLLTYTVVSLNSIIEGFKWTIDFIDFILKPIKLLFKSLTGG
jgi:hypothetical protein